MNEEHADVRLSLLYREKKISDDLTFSESQFDAIRRDYEYMRDNKLWNMCTSPKRRGGMVFWFLERLIGTEFGHNVLVIVDDWLNYAYRLTLFEGGFDRLFAAYAEELKKKEKKEGVNK